MFRPDLEEHFIEAGRVSCPLRERDVEFDVCASCQWCTSIDLNEKLPVVRCRPKRKPFWLGRPWL